MELAKNSSTWGLKQEDQSSRSMSQRPNKYKTKSADTGVDSFSLSPFYPSLGAGVYRMRASWDMACPKTQE